jgi:hypothetical protein
MAADGQEVAAPQGVIADLIRHEATRRMLAVARGHPYDRNAFAALCSGLDEFDVCLVEQPAAQALLNPADARDYDAILHYDMPGVDFTDNDAPVGLAPAPAFRKGYLDMLEAGIGVVYLHHAIAAWPAWPEYAEIVGGRFHYRGATLRGRDWPDSGYRHGVEHRLAKVGQHPVTAGLPDSFTMIDELYLCPVFEEEVVPLLRSDYRFEEDGFYSAARAVAGEMFSRQGWSHPAGSALVAWATRYGNSPLVYLQGGDDAAALGDPNFRRLVHNAVRWVVSDAAHAWARGD